MWLEETASTAGSIEKKQNVNVKVWCMVMDLYLRHNALTSCCGITILLETKMSKIIIIDIFKRTLPISLNHLQLWWSFNYNQYS